MHSFCYHSIWKGGGFATVTQSWSGWVWELWSKSVAIILQLSGARSANKASRRGSVWPPVRAAPCRRSRWKSRPPRCCRWSPAPPAGRWAAPSAPATPPGRGQIWQAKTNISIGAPGHKQVRYRKWLYFPSNETRSMTLLKTKNEKYLGYRKCGNKQNKLKKKKIQRERIHARSDLTSRKSSTEKLKGRAKGEGRRGGGESVARRKEMQKKQQIERRFQLVSLDQSRGGEVVFGEKMRRTEGLDKAW